MKILKCNSCGKYLHDTTMCHFCGNKNDFEEIENKDVHSNVEKKYIEALEALHHRRFNTVLEITYDIIEWMPKCSEIYWLRLLAINQCTKDSELIHKGSLLEKSSDYFNALTFADEIEKQVYTNVEMLINGIRDNMLKTIKKKEYESKKHTEIIKFKENMQQRLKEQEQKLFELWEELEQIELTLHSLELDCNLLINEYWDMILKAKDQALEMKNRLYKLEECTDEERHIYQIQLGTILQQAESSYKSIDGIKQRHPWVIKFLEGVSTRNMQVEKISKELVELKRYETEIERKIKEFEEIDRKYKEAIKYTQECEFEKVIKLLNDKEIEQIFDNIYVLS